jgi:hypothetical protein
VYFSRATKRSRYRVISLNNTRLKFLGKFQVRDGSGKSRAFSLLTDGIKTAQMSTDGNKSTKMFWILILSSG